MAWFYRKPARSAILKRSALISIQFALTPPKARAGFSLNALTLFGLVLAVGASWHRDASQNRLMLSVPRRKRTWFAGLWANASAPPIIHGLQNA